MIWLLPIQPYSAAFCTSIIIGCTLARKSYSRLPPRRRNTRQEILTDIDALHAVIKVNRPIPFAWFSLPTTNYCITTDACTTFGLGGAIWHVVDPLAPNFDDETPLQGWFMTWKNFNKLPNTPTIDTTTPGIINYLELLALLISELLWASLGAGHIIIFRGDNCSANKWFVSGRTTRPDWNPPLAVVCHDRLAHLRRPKVKYIHTDCNTIADSLSRGKPLRLSLVKPSLLRKTITRLFPKAN